MRPSKRLKWFIFFLAACVICLIRAKCTQAAEASDVNDVSDWFIPSGTLTTPIPFDMPDLPDPTSIPDEFFRVSNVQQVYRDALRASSLNGTNIMYKPYTVTRLYGQNYVFQDISLLGATHTSSSPYWMPGTDEALTGNDFRASRVIKYKNQYSFTPYTQTRKVSFKVGSFAFSFLDQPQADVDRSCRINYLFSADGLSLQIVNSVPAFDTLGIDNSMFDDFQILVTCTSHVYEVDLEYEYDYIHKGLVTTWSEFKSGIECQLNFDFMDDNELLEYNFITVVVDPHIVNNPVLQLVYDYYNTTETPAGDRVYGYYGLSGNGLTFSRVLSYTEDKHKMNWFEKLIFPDPEWVSSYLSSFVGTLNQNNTASWVFAFRGLIYNFLSGDFGDFELTIPPLKVLNHTFFDGSTFNFTALIMRTSTLRSLRVYLRLAINILLTTVFLNSVVTAVLGFFNLKLFSGVIGDDVAEA